MGSNDEDLGGYFQSLHGAIASLAEENRLRLNEFFNEVSRMREAVAAVNARLDGLEATQADLARDVASVAAVLDEESAGLLNRIRHDLESLKGDLVEVRARMADSELSVLDAYLLNHPRSSGSGAKKEGATNNG